MVATQLMPMPLAGQRPPFDIGLPASTPGVRDKPFLGVELGKRDLWQKFTRSLDFKEKPEFGRKPLKVLDGF